MNVQIYSASELHDSWEAALQSGLIGPEDQEHFVKAADFQALNGKRLDELLEISGAMVQLKSRLDECKRGIETALLHGTRPSWVSDLLESLLEEE